MKKNLELEIILYLRTPSMQLMSQIILYLRTPSMQLMSRIQLIFDNLVYEIPVKKCYFVTNKRKIHVYFLTCC
jgi:hypothetical protein